jgi:hypothetical protein
MMMMCKTKVCIYLDAVVLLLLLLLLVMLLILTPLLLPWVRIRGFDDSER